MKNNSPPSTTRRIGKSQGYLGLSVTDTQMGDGTPMMMTSWQPTPAEIARLSAGAPIYLWILGTAHPPVMVSVGYTPKSRLRSPTPPIFYVDRRGVTTSVVMPKSKMGVARATILGIDVSGFVSLEAERGLCMMYWPAIRDAAHHPIGLPAP